MSEDIDDIGACVDALEAIASKIEAVVPKLRAAAARLKTAPNIEAYRTQIDAIFAEYEAALKEL